MITLYENTYGLFLSPRHLIKKTVFCLICFPPHLFVLIQQYMHSKSKVRFEILFDNICKVKNFNSDFIIRISIFSCGRWIFNWFCHLWYLQNRWKFTWSKNGKLWALEWNKRIKSYWKKHLEAKTQPHGSSYQVKLKIFLSQTLFFDQLYDWIIFLLFIGDQLFQTEFLPQHIPNG